MQSVIDISGVPLTIKIVKVSFKVSQVDLNVMKQCQTPQNKTITIVLIA